jgi:HPt (histidine-containing phosphotransfer) domain-containing protein
MGQVGKFIKVLQDAQVSLHKAVADENSEAVAEIAHNMRSMARQMGASGVVAICERLDRLVEEGALSGVESQIQQLGKMLEKISQQMQLNG